MKKHLPLFILLLIANLFYVNNINAQFALGDIAFTAYNSDGTADQFSFVLLRNVSAGEQIAFTENGWKGDGTGFRTGENTCILTFANNYNCGSQIFISANPFGARDESMSSAGTLTGNGLALSTSGDQIFAYDPANTPSSTDSSGFVAAIHMNGAWDSTATNTNESALPGVFTDGVNAIAIIPEVDNAQYNCSTTSGNPSPGLDTTINNMNNWNVDNTNNFTAPAPCTLSCSAPPCNDPSIPTATTNPQTVCDGDSVLMTISGNLNDATMWNIYTASCGGTLVASTTGNTAMVSVSAPSTTYFIRGEGGCVTPGSCGQITAFGLVNDDATFSYPTNTYCTNDGPTTPTANTPNGTYTSSPTGLSLNPNTGVITPSTSTPNTYTVYYTTNGTCPSTDSTTITISICTSIKTPKVEDFVIYPNPTSGLITIEVNNNMNQAVLTVSDILGKEILNQTITSKISKINLSDLNKGVYFINVDGNSISSTKKIILE